MSSAARTRPGCRTLRSWLRNLNISPDRWGASRRLLCAFAFLIALTTPAWPIDPHRAVSQYVRERWSTNQHFPRESFYSITQTPDGYLWIATATGLIRFD